MLRDAWALAIEALLLIETRKLSERLALVRASRELDIKGSRERSLAHKLVCETVRRQNFADHIVNSVLKPGSMKDLPPDIQAFMRLYTYEVKFRGSDSYERAANIARIGRSILGWQRLMEVESFLGFLLSVKPRTISGSLSDEEKTSLVLFQPLWFVKYCVRLLGRHEALQLFKSTLRSPPAYIRVNTLKLANEDLATRVEAEDIGLEKVEGLKHTYRVVYSKRPLVRTRCFRAGLFYIQDKASCLAAEVANPKADMKVLDVCAAPGAKTTYLAQLMENRGEIYSLDYSQRRMKVWRNEARRMGVKIAVPMIGDACSPLPLVNFEADVVVLDPPCTSTGAFGRMPSAKWRLSKKSMKRMAAIQWKMLNICAEFVKEGGSLVYSTCSLAVEENEVLVERFLRLNPEFALAEAEPRIGLSGLRGQTASQRLYPHIHDCNGFFIAKLLKIP